MTKSRRRCGNPEEKIKVRDEHIEINTKGLQGGGRAAIMSTNFSSNVSGMSRCPLSEGYFSSQALREGNPTSDLQGLHPPDETQRCPAKRLPRCFLRECWERLIAIGESLSDQDFLQ